ncbi:hypothetical protein [Mesorhizobium sp. NPDC059025]|uniref:hypothetical protein n=1 Tax=unclassified Mesorhizobium TaxID=325217 RepID=UPI0036CF0A2A
MARKWMILGFSAVATMLASPVFANDQSEFCSGFEEGFKSVKGDMAMVPMCPIAPITPIGSTPFEKG